MQANVVAGDMATALLWAFAGLLLMSCKHAMSCVDEQVSFGPISWLIVGEVFPLAVRGQAAALATVTNFGSNFLVGSSD